MRLLAILLVPPQVAGSGDIGGVGVGPGPALSNGAGFPWIPVLLLAVPAVVAVGLIWLYLRTSRRMRQAQLAPPVWLLPYLEHPPENAPVWPPTQSSAEVAADLADRAESVDRLARRKRAILLGLALNFVAGWAMAAAYLYESNRVVDFQELPETSFLENSVDTLGYAGLETEPELVPGVAPGRPDTTPAPDTAEIRRRNEQRQAFFRRRDSLAAIARADSIAGAERAAAEEAQRLRDSLAERARDSIARATIALVPEPAPPPLPPPAPPPPDPAEELARATTVLQTGVSALVAALGAERLTAALGPADAREQLGRFLGENHPEVTLGSLSETTVQGTRAEAVASVQLQWRGAFGDTRRRTIRFRAAAVREAAGWRLTSMTPLDNLP